MIVLPSEHMYWPSLYCSKTPIRCPESQGQRQHPRLALLGSCQGLQARPFAQRFRLARPLR